MRQTLAGFGRPLHHTQALERLPAERERVELFSDFWVMRTRQPEIRTRVRAALERYRRLVAEVTGPMIAAEPATFGRISMSRRTWRTGTH